MLEKFGKGGWSAQSFENIWSSLYRTEHKFITKSETETDEWINILHKLSFVTGKDIQLDLTGNLISPP